MKISVFRAAGLKDQEHTDFKAAVLLDVVCRSRLWRFCTKVGCKKENQDGKYTRRGDVVSHPLR